jgi:threonine aldolase
MTTITIKEDVALNETEFDTAQELIEELAESSGYKIAWQISDDTISSTDKALIDDAKNSAWDSLDDL